MPMIDLYAPSGVLSSEQISSLSGRIVETVNREEGYASSRLASSISWCYVHELPPLVGIKGTQAPVWRVEIATPAGSLDGAAKARLGPAIAGLILAAEGAAYDENQARRVWCLFRDVAEGDWLAGERVATVEAIRCAVAREIDAGRC